MDFGYNPDPIALIAIYYYNGGYIVDEILYATDMKNSQIASTIINLPRALVVADSAEPKSIAEIKGFGVNIIGAIKGKESVRYGIKVVQAQRMSVTKGSLNVIKEYRNFFQAVDRKTNLMIPSEYDGEEHALTAIRYGICSIIPIIQARERILNSIPMRSKPRINMAV